MDDLIDQTQECFEELLQTCREVVRCEEDPDADVQARAEMYVALADSASSYADSLARQRLIEQLRVRRQMSGDL